MNHQKITSQREFDNAMMNIVSRSKRLSPQREFENARINKTTHNVHKNSQKTNDNATQTEAQLGMITCAPKFWGRFTFGY